MGGNSDAVSQAWPMLLKWRMTIRLTPASRSIITGNEPALVAAVLVSCTPLRNTCAESSTRRYMVAFRMALGVVKVLVKYVKQ